MITMDALSEPALLEAWERGLQGHPLERGLMLYALACKADTPDALADHPIGWRNRALLELHVAWLGDTLDAFVDCPRCAERLEFAISIGGLLAPAQGAGISRSDDGAMIEVDGLRVRLPTTRDLQQLTGEVDEVRGAERLLLALVQSDTEGSAVAALGERIGAALEAADPCASFRFELACPACAHAWSAPFDPAGYLWDQLALSSRRLLDEVHVLANAYGWSEREILGLSPTRRRAYLERVLG